MRQKRVLVINQYFPPDTAATAKMVAQLVAHLSHHFTIPLHPKKVGRFWSVRVGLYDRALGRA